MNILLFILCKIYCLFVLLERLIRNECCRYTASMSFMDCVDFEDFKLEKGPTDKAKEPDPGGSDQQNLGYKKLKNRKTDRTVGLNFCVDFATFLGQPVN